MQVMPTNNLVFKSYICNHYSETNKAHIRGNDWNNLVKSRNYIAKVEGILEKKENTIKTVKEIAVFLFFYKRMKRLTTEIGTTIHMFGI